MSKISLTVLNRSITLNCKDGDETKITAVAERLQQRLQTLKQGLQASDLETLIIGSVILLDALETATAKYDTLKAHTQNNKTTDTDMPISTLDSLEDIVNKLEKLIDNTPPKHI